MELLFEKTGTNGSTELKEVLGFIDADIDIVSIKPDIITATNELIKLFGQPYYDSVVTAYKDADASADDKYLVYITRYPIAIRAYMLLAPNNDIAHTSNGRKMRQTADLKQAFQWMIDKDNEAIERRYYRALDDLIQFLDKNNDDWKESEAFKKSHKLFLRTADDFNEYFPIQSRLILIKLEPGLRKCEQDEILSRLGRTRFDELKTKLKDNTEITDEAELQLLGLIKEACAYYSLAWAMPRLSVNLFPEGVLQAYTSDRDITQIKRPAAKLEAEVARMAFTADAAAIFLRIEALLSPPPAPDASACQEPTIITGTNYISL